MLMKDNQECCDFEFLKFQIYYDEIVVKFDKKKKNIEIILMENLKSKNVEVDMKKLELEKKVKNVMDLVNFLEGKYSILFDYSLISNFRDLNNLLFNIDSDKENGDYFVRYRRGVISEGLLDFMMGEMFYLVFVFVIEVDLFKYGFKNICVLRVINEDLCIIVVF